MANIQIERIEISGGTALGIRIGNPQNPEKPVIIVILGKKGMLVCRNFDIHALEQRGISAVRVQGITSFEEMLNAPIESFTIQAQKLGIEKGMKGSDALSRFL
jgi:uncharacterized protein YunC (DUF1805 family)